MTALSKALQNWNLGVSLPKLGLGFFKDPVVIAMIIGFIGLSIIDRPQVISSAVFTVEALLGMAPFFLLAIVFAAYAKASGSDALIARAFAGSDHWYTIPLATLIGIPSYLNGYAAIPLVSGLIDMGMSPGAAMAFITSGAVSSIPAALAVYALVKKPVFALYVLLGLTGSMLVGYAYQLSGGVI